MSESLNRQRLRLQVSGQVQGVGFRPFVYRLARELDLGGVVYNTAGGVCIEIEGAAELIQNFRSRLKSEAPPLTIIRDIEETELPCVDSRNGFAINASQGGIIDTGVTPDAAICHDCLEELLNPADRRYRYSFINCTHCGPRYTITRSLPYDRPNTSMAPFTQCSQCKTEYEEPTERRFHAQPNACPECGPELELWQPDGKYFDCDDPLATTLRLIQAGKIVAIKGLGGFHLACDARNPEAVARLRQRKQRDEKPFAIMAANHVSLRELAEVEEGSATLLNEVERPIVLLPKTAKCDQELVGVAPGVDSLGAMLPCTPIHYLLFHQAAGQPAGTVWLEQPQSLLLVMTSANPGGEPLVTGNQEAVRRLSAIADALLVHDRAIVVRCDDSVVRWQVQAPALVRRARGYTPRAIQLPASGPSLLACGGWFKNTVCLTRGDEAYLSQHIGDLESAATCEALEETVEHLTNVLQIEPEAVVHDLHPDFYSSRYAEWYAGEHQLPLIPVQHHHAHIAAIAAEHCHTDKLLGVAFDGVGLGSDNQPWGGELLQLTNAECQRVGHLRPLNLPGGDQAARQPWRMAVSVLYDLGEHDQIRQRLGQERGNAMLRMLERGINTPKTSSAGRLFDAAAGLLGVREAMSFEGQAAMELESLAWQHGAITALDGGFNVSDAGQLDLLPTLEQLHRISSASEGAALFHATLVAGVVAWVLKYAEQCKIRTVALSGGCFLNRLLSSAVRAGLESDGVTVLEARQVPPNDGGLSLGQAWVAMQILNRVAQ